MPRFPFPLPRSPYPRPRRRYPRRVGLIGAIALLIAAIAGGMQQCQTPTQRGPAETPTVTTPAQPAANSAERAAIRAPERPPERWETVDAEPVTARDEVRGIWDTVVRVARGPPFPYRQDGAAFQNRESRLAKRPSGWWREYTVETPGSDDRGARRLVIGADGEVWYTNDHYRSFRRLLLP